MYRNFSLCKKNLKEILKYHKSHCYVNATFILLFILSHTHTHIERQKEGGQKMEKILFSNIYLIIIGKFHKIIKIFKAQLHL